MASEWTAPYDGMDSAELVVMQSTNDPLTLIDLHTARLEHMLTDKPKRQPNYSTFQQPGGPICGMVNGEEREMYINQMLRIGNFVGLDSNSLLIAVHMFDRFQASHCVNAARALCVSGCLTQKAGHKRRVSEPCKMCHTYKVLMTYNTLIGALILAGQDHFTTENGFGDQSDTVKNMMKLVDPKLDLFLNFNQLPHSQQAKFNKLLSGQLVPQHRDKIKAYLGDSLLQIPPANQFLNIFAGLLSQHVSESCLERARTRLVEVHKWHQCLVAPSALIAWTVLTESIGTEKAAQDNRELHTMMKLLQGISLLEITDERVAWLKGEMSKCAEFHHQYLCSRRREINAKKRDVFLKTKFMNFTLPIKKIRQTFRKKYTEAERDSKYGTICIRGARKECIQLGVFYEAEEDAFNRSNSPTDSIDSTGSH